MTAQVREFFGEGIFDFAILIGELKELQSLAKGYAGIDYAGPFVILRRLETMSALLEDIHHVLRLGLIGAGMDKKAAFELVERQVKPGGILDAMRLAYVVLAAGLAGAPDAPPEGEPAPEAAGQGEASSSTTAASASTSSMAEGLA